MIQRVFLGWDRPALAAAADWLAARYATGDSIDMSRAIVAVPGGRAGRRLEELLLERGEAAGLPLAPPQTITVGHLPEMLYLARRPFADRLTQQLAWIEALDRTDPAQLAHLVAELPAKGDLSGRLALGEMLARLHRELAADDLDFRRVAECGAALEDFPEEARWEALAVVQNTYLRILDELELWDLQTARLYAIDHHECHTDGEVILVGTVDLNLAQRRILDQISEHVTALVFAPEQLSERFDSHGCLAVGAWQDARLPLRDEQIEIAGGPADQAAAIIRAIACFEGRFAADELTIGVPSESLLPYVEQSLAQCEIPARYGPGRPIARTSPYRLLAATADYLETRSFWALAALLRHTAVGDWLVSQQVRGDWLTEADEYQAAHLPASADGSWCGSAKSYAALKDAYAALSALIESSFGRLAPGAVRPLSGWGQPILDYLTAIFGVRILERDREPGRTHWLACKAARDALASHAALNRLGSLQPPVGAAEAIRLALRQLESQSIAPPPEPGAVELLGWLELPWDDAPALVVCGLNDQTIPDSVNADLFLPDRIRRQLGIEDNDRRYARDLYALSVLIASRQELRVIAGRTSPEGSPLAPSRLLFACDDETVARRALGYFGDRPGAPAVILPGSLRPGQARSALLPPQPPPSEDAISSMRVTEFRDYLACPYRYYLKHRLGLAALADSGAELDAAAFGSLAHDVLADFGESELAASTNADEICLLLDELLNRRVRQEYGKQPLPAVHVQIAQLRHRLASLARWQADWAGKGWRIVHVEKDLAASEVSLTVDGLPLGLRGRIDRIDFNEATGEWAILDYKTSESGKKPEQTHQKGGEWIDLQLPLYLHLASALELEGPIQLGYIVLPKDVTRIGALIADWSEEDLESAGGVAEEVVRRVRRGVFWPPKTPPPPFSEEFAAICQDGQFGALAESLLGEGGDAE